MRSVRRDDSVMRKRRQYRQGEARNNRVDDGGYISNSSMDDHEPWVTRNLHQGNQSMRFNIGYNSEGFTSSSEEEYAEGNIKSFQYSSIFDDSRNYFSTIFRDTAPLNPWPSIASKTSHYSAINQNIQRVNAAGNRELISDSVRMYPPTPTADHSDTSKEKYYLNSKGELGAGSPTELSQNILGSIRPQSYGVAAKWCLLFVLLLSFILDLLSQNSNNIADDERRYNWLTRLGPAFLDVVSHTRVITVGHFADKLGHRPDFVYEHPYVSSSYYTSTKSMKTLKATEEIQVRKSLMRAAEEKESSTSKVKTRLAIVRPFCEFDAEALPTTFTCWNALPPCKAAHDDIGDDERYHNFITEYQVGVDGELTATQNSTRIHVHQLNEERHLFDNVGSDAMKTAKADVFLFYSQTFSENEVAIKAVDAIIDQFFEPGGWSQCFENIFAIEANIPQELDLYIPSAQEDLYNWVNGPNRQYEAAFRIIQSGEWGDYDGFYLMEGDSVPIKSYWLDVLLSEVEVHRPFAILGAQYDGDKWDNFYEKIPISLLHHTNGNAIYNTSHPLLERLVGQLEVEAPCPYNSIPYDYRMSQMWVEGTLGIVPKLAPKIMLNEEGENITLSNNTEMFSKWAEIWMREDPFKYTPVIHNYAATNLIPRHLGPEYIIHGAKLYSPWDPTKTQLSLVVSEWFFDRSLHLIEILDSKDHPFSEVVVMVPPAAITHDDYDLMTDIPVRTQHRGAPDFMDLCEADVKTDWFMITNSYHNVARHVDLMFTPGTYKPVIPFTPATYPFCFKFPYCKETINLAQRFNPGHDKVVQDMDMIYNTKMRNVFCEEWKEKNGDEGEDMYKNQQRRLMFRKKIIGPSGPTGTSYFAWLIREGKDDMYKMTDRSLYGARPPFIKIFAREEKLDGLSEDELAKRVGMTLLDNSTDSDCNCMLFETEVDCLESGIGCIWRPLFESCHPPELMDGDEPICATTEAPTMSPTVSLDGIFDDTEIPTSAPNKPVYDKSDYWYVNMFKSREHESTQSGTTDDNVEDLTLTRDDDDDAVDTQDASNRRLSKVDENVNIQTIDDARRNLEALSLDSYYETDVNGNSSSVVPLELRKDRLFSVSRFDKDSDVSDNTFTLLQWNIKNHNLTSLPKKQCEPWGPNIVPRDPTVSKIWIGASPDPESRAYSVMSTTRPRKLHPSYLKSLQNHAQMHSALTDSWLTSVVPINVPKYTMRSNQSPSKQISLSTPDESNEILRMHKSNVDYGDSHPFDGAQIVTSRNYQPLRISFIMDSLIDLRNQHTATNDSKKEALSVATLSKIEALTGDILPSVSELYAGALYVVRVLSNIFPATGSQSGNCGEYMIPHHHLMEGVPNTDSLIYVTANGRHCFNEDLSTTGTSGVTSYSILCTFDQHMRPLTGNLVVCLNNISVAQGEVPEAELLRVGASLTMEVGKMLGLSPDLFQYFRNPETGKPWGVTTKTVTCVNGVKQTLSVPNILQSSLDKHELGRVVGDDPYFLIVSPIVKQVVRNHFDCQSLFGARLDQKSSSCFGDLLDPLFHFDEDLSSLGATADMAYSLSPLTLALFEDSSWYKADFSKSTVPLFGRGAGCGFMLGNCITNFKAIPEYSRDFFCIDLIEGHRKYDHQPSSCDYTHNHKADCELVFQKNTRDDSNKTGYTSTVYPTCPMRTKNIVSCVDTDNAPSLKGEVFSVNSRCFETDTPQSICLQSYCNSVDFKIDIILNERVYQCDYEGQKIDLESGFQIYCPRLAVICPHLVCPSNCSGKGVCDYCLDIPRCICDNPFDETPGCWGDFTPMF